MILKNRRKNKERKKIFGKHKIHWYRCIPYVIAEIINPEWKGLQVLEKEKKMRFNQLRKIYNSNGNWYVLEGLDYFWFGWTLLTNTENNILFSDSMWLIYNNKSDKEKYKLLQDHAKENIDNKWNNIYSIFKKNKK